MNRTRNKGGLETIKSVTLVVLFFTTILLLYFLWEDKPFQQWARSDDLTRREAPRYDEILQPSQVVVCSGGGSYALAPDAFAPLIDSLKAFAESESLIMEEIAERQYKEGLLYPSVEARFAYYVPFSAIREVFQIQRITGSDNLDAFSALAYSEAYPDNFFIFDKSNNKYYRIAGDAGDAFPELSKSVADAGRRATHFTLETNFGGQVDNQTLIPYSPESDRYDFDCTGELDTDEEERAARITRIAKSFFNDNFDFVRKIEELNGTVIYMYGFGKIVLIIDKDGAIEFKREEEERAPAPTKYLDALGKALDFIAEHGAFETFSGISFSPRLKTVVVDPDGKRGYRFVFGISVNDLEVFYQDSDAFTVEVVGNGVTYFKRELICYDEEQIKDMAGDFREICSAMNALAHNLEYISAVLYSVNPAEIGSSNLTIEALAERVDWLDHAYIKLADTGERNKTRAAWLLKIEQLEFYFGLDDGVPLGYSQK